MKVSELTGTALDYWTAKSIDAIPGHEFRLHFEEPFITLRSLETREDVVWAPSTNWAHGGPIIERKKIMVSWNVDHWISGANDATDNPNNRIWSGRTALIAAMRAQVASKFGDEVPD